MTSDRQFRARGVLRWLSGLRRGTAHVPAPGRLRGAAHLTSTVKVDGIRWAVHSPKCHCQSAPDAFSRQSALTAGC